MFDENRANHSPEDAEDLELDDQAAEQVQGGAVPIMSITPTGNASNSPIEIDSFSFGGSKGSATTPSKVTAPPKKA